MIAKGGTSASKIYLGNTEVQKAYLGTEIVYNPVKEYIVFEDPVVEQICIANWSSDGIGVTMDDAAAVTDFEKVFQNTSIVKFNEMNYFTNVKALPGHTAGTGSSFFTGSTIEEIGLDNITAFNGGYNLAGLALKSVYLPNLVRCGRYIMDGCTSLHKVEIGASLTSLDFGCWRNCSSLTVAIFHSITPPTSGINNFRGTPIANGTGYIYVPDASVEAYKAATNWSTYSSQIVGLSSYSE